MKMGQKKTFYFSRSAKKVLGYFPEVPKKFFFFFFGGGGGVKVGYVGVQ